MGLLGSVARSMGQKYRSWLEDMLIDRENYCSMATCLNQLMNSGSEEQFGDTKVREAHLTP